MDQGETVWDELGTISGEIHHCRTIEEANNLIRVHEKENHIKFVVQCARKNFGQSDWRSQVKSVKWQCKGWSYDGSPLAVTSIKALDCKQGKDRHRSSRYQGVSYPSEQRKSKQTVKLDCPARLIIKEIIRFPSYQIANASKYNRRNTSKELRAALKKGANVMSERWYIVSLPSLSSHTCGGPIVSNFDDLANKPTLQHMSFTLAELQQLVTSTSDPVISSTTITKSQSLRDTDDEIPTAVASLVAKTSSEDNSGSFEGGPAEGHFDDPDEFQQFGTFVANELRSLPTQQHKLTLMLKIQDIFTEAQQNTQFYA